MEDNRLRRVEWINLNLPSLRDFDRYIGWMLGRILFSGWLFTLTTIRATAKIVVVIVDQCERTTHKLLEVYAQMPHGGTLGATVINTSAVALPPAVSEIVTDIVSAIEGKHLMIIGATGSGKTVAAQYLAYAVGGKVRVLECEGTPDDWVGLEVVGRGEDWESINEAFAEEMEELTNRVKIRNSEGDKALIGRDQITIVEEYPEVRQKCSNADEWFERHARRGRRMLKFIICLSQFDKVAAWGLEGKSDLGDCFYRLRIGKLAVKHARSLGNDELEAWLQLDRSHCLLDDSPCKLPSYREMKAVTQRLSNLPVSAALVTAVTPIQSQLQPIENENNYSKNSVTRAVKACLEAGFSESKIVKEVLGYKGGQYQAGKEVLERIKAEF